MANGTRPAWRTKSVESVLGRIPDVSSGSLMAHHTVSAAAHNGGGGGGAAAVMRALTASVSTPSLVAQERARASAREKMTPNLDLDNDDGAAAEVDEEVEAILTDNELDAAAADPEIRVTEAEEEEEGGGKEATGDNNKSAFKNGDVKKNNDGKAKQKQQQQQRQRQRQQLEVAVPPPGPLTRASSGR